MSTAEEHPDWEEIGRFIRRELTRQDAAVAKHVVRHLLTGCPDCQKVARAIWYSTEAPLARLVLVSGTLK